MTLPGLSHLNFKSRMGIPMRKIAGNVHLILVFTAIIIGLLAGFSALGFRFAIAEIQNLFYGFRSENVVTLVADVPWWQIMLIPVLCGLIIGVFLRYVMPGKRPQGVADVIEGVMVNRGKMSMKAGLGAIFVSSVSLGMGTSGGREGPIVHFGATLASYLGQLLRFPSSHYMTMVGCGVAAAVAASFNAPFAGAFFALEVIIGTYAIHAFAPIVISSVIGTVISRVYVGDFPAFIIPHYSFQSLWQFPAIAILGMVSALVALIFICSVSFAEETIDKFHIPDILRPAAGGLVLGGIAVFYPQMIGVVSEATYTALKAGYPLTLLLTLIVVKTVAVGVTFGSRFGGGFFSPSLFIGAMTGGAFGIIAASVFPELAASHGLYAIIGMSAVAASVLGAPISTILIVFEITGDYKIAIAVMVAVSVSSLITKQIIGKSIFSMQLLKHNLDMKENRAIRHLKHRHVSGVMVKNFCAIRKDATMSEMRSIVRHTHHDNFVVVEDNDTNRLVGRTIYCDLAAGLLERQTGQDRVAANFADDAAPHLYPNMDLNMALWIMDQDHIETAVVIDSEDSRVVVGIVHYKDLLHAYNQSLLAAESETRGKIYP